jgi:hydroxymethylbilane synthase
MFLTGQVTDKVLRIGARPSRLSLKQAEEMGRHLRGAKFEIIPIYTQGDKDKLTPISGVEGTDFFTKEIDSALLAEEIDMAVHSTKDLPTILPEGLEVIFKTPSISPYEALVTRDRRKLNELAAGSSVGTSSARRKAQIMLLRNDLKVVSVRGDIYERIALVKEGKIDALIVAHAALIRLGLQGCASEIFPLDVFPAHIDQGKLSLVARKGLWQKVKFI